MPRRELSNRVEYRNSAGQLHRNGDLPAIEWNGGAKEWFINGKRHRVDGPALIWSDGDKSWCLNGKYYSESDYYPDLYLYKGIIS